MKEPIKIALPKGRLLADTAFLLKNAGWEISDYKEGTRLYNLKSDRFNSLTAKIFHEKDIPIQVSIGNYDLGICGLDWIEELISKYPGSSIIKIKDLGYGVGKLVMGSSLLNRCTKSEMRNRFDIIRIASEYPNLAESFAAKNRIKRFSIIPLWGAAEVYPPENAEMVLVSYDKSFSDNLYPLDNVMDYSSYLIANKHSWETKDISYLLSSLEKVENIYRNNFPIPITTKPNKQSKTHRYDIKSNTVRIALPDGHQQKPTAEFLAKAGIVLDDYTSLGDNRRPSSDISGVTFKVIRPQDIPLQLANGNFDMAITGRDWLLNHLYQFPSSPVVELLDLKYGRVKIVAVVSNEVTVSDPQTLRRFWKDKKLPLRLASEYVNIADRYARDNHLGMYRVIPTWGATEAFLPIDADLLIENTETGQTLARHNLKIIDTLFESTACLIGYNNANTNPVKKSIMNKIIGKLNMVIKAR
jgi:ATP phosphoribosyltransferase